MLIPEHGRGGAIVRLAKTICVAWNSSNPPALFRRFSTPVALICPSLGSPKGMSKPTTGVLNALPMGYHERGLIAKPEADDWTANCFMNRTACFHHHQHLDGSVASFIIRFHDKARSTCRTCSSTLASRWLDRVWRRGPPPSPGLAMTCDAASRTIPITLQPRPILLQGSKYIVVLCSSKASPFDSPGSCQMAVIQISAYA